MDTNGKLTNGRDPFTEFYEVLFLVWEKITKEYDVQAMMPNIATLLRDVEFFDPCMSAETIIRNMLSEATQLVHRFSPWYKLPARSFGLVSYRDIISHQNEWRLAPEAQQKWQDLIELISSEIYKKEGLIKAIQIIDKIDILDQESDVKILAVCECDPPNELLIKKTFLKNKKLLCRDCEEIFSPKQPDSVE